MLDQFDGDFLPIVPGRTAGVDTLPDGDYILEVVSAELTTTRHTGDDIVRWAYKVLHGGVPQGSIFESVTFLRGQDSANRLGSDLMLMGVATNEWTAASGKPFSKMLPQTLPTLKGVKLKVSKTSSTAKSGKMYHNLNINSRTTQAEMPVDADMPF